MKRALTASTILLFALSGPVPADQVLESARRVPEDGRSTPLRPLHWERRGIFGGPLGGHQQHDREVPFFRNDPHQRIWNGPPQWGAAMRQEPWQPPEPPVTGAGELPEPGGDLRRRIQRAIRKNRLQRYNNELEAMRLLEQYRAEKAMLGLCPVDGCLEPRLVIEARPFSNRGYCREHAEEFLGARRVKWAMESAERRAHRREDERRARQARREEGGRFRGDPREVTTRSLDARTRANQVRELFFQAPLPEEFPRAADLGPNGTLPPFADPRDPAGYPYDTLDTDPHPYRRPVEKETRSWVQRSLSAP